MIAGLANVVITGLGFIITVAELDPEHPAAIPFTVKMVVAVGVTETGDPFKPPGIHTYVVPATELITDNEEEAPRHIAAGIADGVIKGVGFTIILYVKGFPVQPLTVGVTEIIAVIGTVPVFVAVNPGIFPIPLAPNPMAVFELDQANVPPAGILPKVVAAIDPLLHTTISEGTIAIGVGFIVIVLVLETAAQPPEAAMLLVTVYVPGVLADKSICPVVVLTNTKPAGTALNTPALAPDANVGNGSLPFSQYGPEYIKVAEGAKVMVTEVVLLEGHAPFVTKVTLYVLSVLALTSISPVI